MEPNTRQTDVEIILPLQRSGSSIWGSFPLWPRRSPLIAGTNPPVLQIPPSWLKIKPYGTPKSRNAPRRNKAAAVEKADEADPTPRRINPPPNPLIPPMPLIQPNPLLTPTIQTNPNQAGAAANSNRLFLGYAGLFFRQAAVGENDGVEHFAAGETAPAAEMVLAGLIAKIRKSFGTHQAAAPWTSRGRLANSGERVRLLRTSAFQNGPTIGQQHLVVKWVQHPRYRFRSESAPAESPSP